MQAFQCVIAAYQFAVPVVVGAVQSMTQVL